MEEHHTKIGNHFYEVFKNSYPNTYSTTLSQFSNEMTQEDLEKSQVLTVGGDGTFISAANKMANNNSYILGINPDTDSSQGFLCGYDIKKNNDQIPDGTKHNSVDEPESKSSTNSGKKLSDAAKLQKEDKNAIWRLAAEEVLDFFIKGKYSIYERDRLELFQHCNRTGENEKLGIGQNEFYFTSGQFMRTFRYDWTDNDICYQNIRSSGLLVSTGTGSSALAMASSQVSTRRIKFQLKEFGMQYTSREQIDQVQAKINRVNQFDPQSKKVFFMHRELIPHCYPIFEEGFRDEIFLSNKTFDGVTYQDGNKYELEYDADYKIKIAPYQNSLACVIQDSDKKIFDKLPARPNLYKIG